MARQHRGVNTHHYTRLTVGWVLWLLFVAGCGTPRPPTTGLYDKARHTGSVTLFRVDDAWHPDPGQRHIYKVGEGFGKRTPPYVPLRDKADIAGLDSPDRIVTADDFVTVTLKSAFIKYFRELGGAKRRGEIALVLSFEAGARARESILIYASQGQTLGSFLDLDDMPIIGPAKFAGDDIMVRIVMIEMDQVENEERKQFIRALATTASTLKPELATALSIAQPIANFIINQNGDDVIMDHRFSLQRVSTGQHSTRNALLYGTYVLLLQEDRLRGTDVSRVAPRAILPPAPDRLRFGAHTDRLYRVYNYFPGLMTGEEEDGDDDQCPLPESHKLTLCGTLDEGGGPIYYDEYFPQPDNATCRDPNLQSLKYKVCVLMHWVNAEPASALRQHTLGYTKTHLGELELFQSLADALDAASIEGNRGEPVVLKRNAEQSAGPLSLNFPMVQYPRAFTVLAQYPLHTHLIFSVDRSLGGRGRAADVRFQAFSAFLEQELGEVREADRMRKLAADLREALVTRERQRKAFEKAASLPDDQTVAKVCILWQVLFNPTGTEEQGEDALADRSVYNEMWHITGEVWTKPDEVIKYLNDANCTVERENATCECSTRAGTS